MHAVMNEAIRAERSEPWSSTSAANPTANTQTAVGSGRVGRPIDGLAQVASDPRAPSLGARRVMATRITRNGRPSGSPCCGSQVNTVRSFVISDWHMPSTSPASAVTANDSKRPTSATPSAGTISSVYEIGSSVESGAIRMPASAASSVAMIQFCVAIRVAEMPIRAAPRLFSAAARVARPKRV